MTDRAELMDDLRQFFTYTDEEQQDIIGKAIAALEAKPEPKAAMHCCTTCGYEMSPHQWSNHSSCPKCCTPVENDPATPLPESVEEWMHAHTVEYDNRDWTEQSVPAHHLRRYLAEMHSQHQAEFELLRSKLALVLRENRRLSNELKKVDAEMEAAKEQGRREALQSVPVEALEWAAGHCDSMMDYETGSISDWIKTACDAQEGGGG